MHLLRASCLGDVSRLAPPMLRPLSAGPPEPRAAAAAAAIIRRVTNRGADGLVVFVQKLNRMRSNVVNSNVPLKKVIMIPKKQHSNRLQ